MKDSLGAARSGFMKFSRFPLPVALLAIAALIAALMALPQTATVEASAGAIESLPSPTTQALETTAHDHAAPAEGEAHDHTLVADVSSTASGHQHSSTPTNAAEGMANESHAHEPPAASVLPTGPIVSVNDPRLTPAQQNAATTLLVASRSSIASFPNTTALAAGGYVSVGDNSSGLQHWVNDAFVNDGLEVNPNHIESFVVNIASGRTVGAMFILEPGKTMANVPNIAGELTTWHIHSTICFSTTQIWRFVSFANNNNCPSGAAPRIVPPMMHVWSYDPPCGPFVGTEGHGSANCSKHAH